MLACVNFELTFHGVAAHAAGAPWDGRSTLDAAELMNVGVNFLKEHVTPNVRVHYSFFDAGGSAPNVVQACTWLRRPLPVQYMTYSTIHRSLNMLTMTL